MFSFQHNKRSKADHNFTTRSELRGSVAEESRYNIITMGYDCSPAQALKDMGLRKCAIPFDWDISTIASLEHCFRNKFSMFHQDLAYNHNKTRLIDHYGFEFPHDYPLLKDVVDCSFVSVVTEHTIVENWADYHSDVCAKYKRRIDRFTDIMNDPRPIIVLCRRDIANVPKLKSLFETHYKKHNVFFVNSTPHVRNNRMSLTNFNISSYVILCHTEKNGKWNETAVWKEALDQAIKQFIIK
jgi:hypothetical protein